MTPRAILSIVLCGLAGSAMGATLAKHTSLETDMNGNPTSIIEIVADANGNLRFEYYGVIATASAGTAASSSADATVEHSRGKLETIMVYNADAEEITVKDGGQCQRISADAEAPGGVSPGEIQGYQKEMQAMQAEMEKAYAEMAKQNPALAEQMKEMMSARGMGNPMMGARPQLEVVETDTTRKVGDYSTRLIEVRDAATGEVRQNVYAAKLSAVEGGELISKGMRGMFGVYQAYMDKLGVSELTGSNLLAAIMDKMKDYYPVMTIDKTGNTRTKLTSVEGSGSAEFSLDCPG